jgi:hypothetical protein
MCDGRHHNLQVIYRVDVDRFEEHVVRWCQDCGGIVVDLESDGRRFGKVMKMKFPKFMYDLVEINKQIKGGKRRE